MRIHTLISVSQTKMGETNPSNRKTKNRRPGKFYRFSYSRKCSREGLGATKRSHALKMFYQIFDNSKISVVIHSPFERSWDENHVCLPFLRVSQKSYKKLRVYMVWGMLSQHYVQTFVWILNHVSRSITWFVFTLKASKSWPSCKRLNLRFSGTTAHFGGARAQISRLFSFSSDKF